MNTVEFSTVTTKGQLVIPSALRRRFGIREGTQVAFLVEDDRLVLQPLTSEYVRRLRGSVKGEASAMNLLTEERSRERQL